MLGREKSSFKPVEWLDEEVHARIRLYAAYREIERACPGKPRAGHLQQTYGSPIACGNACTARTSGRHGRWLLHDRCADRVCSRALRCQKADQPFGERFRP